ncbi:TPA: hypothetical protein ACXDAY_002191 [Clostridium botulinum]|uniref:hypothetical protein n=1 Tax=Clostridium botulinum TaxID=1491 RepID=UPI0004675806|nr:hypothetical protein [Clostridium botulinum]APH20880.1 hypothetical protein NPD1_4177 [Clostridium botulinum]APQ71339.1 hypothetical protein RSJ8_4134 [Clostridium botulinum]APR02515.1 hypothetical protein RSJ2_3998 [Clostridium botulinum]AUN01527.1 hypothetical protein RSJ19_00660 [Clostridium botulinum]MBN3359243.1 hypothetical protein [Clostridium botulinum]
MKFKVGDRVRVRTDLEDGHHYGGWAYVCSMDKFKGESVTIKKCCVDSYKIREGEISYNWSDEMLEPIQEDFTFQEVIARIEPNETYESEWAVTFRKFTSIHMDEFGSLELHYIENNTKRQSNSLFNDTVFIGVNQRFRLKETKKPFIIYYIEHKPNEKQYKFRSNERLDINDFVICDTKFGRVYGKVVSYEEMELTNAESEQYKKCWKA